MNAYSDKTRAILKPQNRFLVQRKEVVDRLSAVGDRLGISNQAIHHASLLLDLYASKETRSFDPQLAALASLLVSCKFLQMKYPSAESLNHAVENCYNY